jgi:hypothetical protein
MNCLQYDLKGYVLDELGAEQRAAAEAHLRTCAACREELDRLRATRTALALLPLEDPPQRIAFVSDKIFEPRGWARWWNSVPRMAFGAAALLALAIVAHGWLQRPAAQPGREAAALREQIRAELAGELQATVEKAVAEATAREARRTAELLEAAERRYQQQRLADRIAFEEAFEVLQKRMNVYRASLAFGSAQ